MLNRRVRIILVSLAMSLAMVSLTSGCSRLKKTNPSETEIQTETETETEKETQSETESETETELQTDISYTSQDRTIRITLPDSTWKVTQDADEMRVFSSGSAAMINIVHAANASAMKNITVYESEEALKESLTKQYSETNAFEVVEFEKMSSFTLDTYEYVVKYNSASMWAYSITYGIIADSEAYVISGTVTDDNKVLMEAVKKAVESFTVLRNAKFNAIPGTVLNNGQTESEEETESEKGSAEAELKTLTDYGTSTKLYASDFVNVRKDPSTESDILLLLSAGDEVIVVGETSQWFKVNILGHIGYVNKAYLVYTPVQQTEPSEEDGSASPEVSDSTKVNAELNSYVDYGSSYTYYTTTDVNLRAQPGTDSGLLGGLNGGTAVSVIGETDNWFVVYVNGTTGYISKSYISSENVAGNTGNTGSTDTSNGNTGSNGSTGSGTPTSGTGTISGTITSATMNTLTVQGDDGRTYTINYTDAGVSSESGIFAGVYISATVDYSNTLPSGELYATYVSGY